MGVKQPPQCRTDGPTAWDYTDAFLGESHVGDETDQDLYGNANLLDRLTESSMLPVGSEEFAKPVPFEDRNAGQSEFSFLSNGLSLGVHVPIHPVNATDEMIERWHDGIDATWNNQFIARQGNTEFPIEFWPEFIRDWKELPDGFNTVEAGGSARSDMRHWRSEDPYRPDDPKRWSDQDSLELEAGHEFGHLINIPDEYGHGPGVFEKITGRSPDPAELRSDGYSYGMWFCNGCCR